MVNTKLPAHGHIHHYDECNKGHSICCLCCSLACQNSLNHFGGPVSGPIFGHDHHPYIHIVEGCDCNIDKPFGTCYKHNHNDLASHYDQTIPVILIMDFWGPFLALLSELGFLLPSIMHFNLPL